MNHERTSDTPTGSQELLAAQDSRSLQDRLLHALDSISPDAEPSQPGLTAPLTHLPLSDGSRISALRSWSREKGHTWIVDIDTPARFAVSRSGEVERARSRRYHIRDGDYSLSPGAHAVTRVIASDREEPITQQEAAVLTTGVIAASSFIHHQRRI
jgi:hypothetical protein